MYAEQIFYRKSGTEMYLYFLSLSIDGCYHSFLSSGSPLPPSLPPPLPPFICRSLRYEQKWIDGKKEGGKWRYVWRRRSIGYYHQHTLSKYGNDQNHFTTWEMDGWMDGRGEESGSEEGMERKRKKKRGVREKKQQPSIKWLTNGKYEGGCRRIWSRKDEGNKNLLIIHF